MREGANVTKDTGGFMMPTRESNRITVNMGGQMRTIVCGMRAFKMVSERMTTNTITLTNASEVMLNIVMLGMRDKPENLTEDLVVDWIDDMDEIERNNLQNFISLSLGFLIADYAKSVEAILPFLQGAE